MSFCSRLGNFLFRCVTEIGWLMISEFFDPISYPSKHGNMNKVYCSKHGMNPCPAYLTGTKLHHFKFPRNADAGGNRCGTYLIELLAWGKVTLQNEVSCRGSSVLRKKVFLSLLDGPF
ncbi:uncharacterized protein LOC112491979 isoform X1 [Ziziphus jujuba]|uniref:Uncharacterized protein LOC112491979 isoform X1 n=1 Tax=Ziziphus jujuba TaxID=326968 RepID=A0A6P6G8E0_ZIZJJ|nr:uncharacterized protein LOC112491979 isoform X1 [Ziziphus jujuba]